MATDKELEALKKALRRKLGEGNDDVTVTATELRTVLDELGRLHQSNERLRRQNRRVRLKLQRAGIADDVAEPGNAAGGDADSADAGPGSSSGD